MVGFDDRIDKDLELLREHAPRDVSGGISQGGLGEEERPALHVGNFQWITDPDTERSEGKVVCTQLPYFSSQNKCIFVIAPSFSSIPMATAHQKLSNFHHWVGAAEASGFVDQAAARFCASLVSRWPLYNYPNPAI